MSVTQSIDSVHQFARLIQIGVVLEELVETRARAQTGAVEEPIRSHLEAAAATAAEHRTRLLGVLDAIDADHGPAEELQTLVQHRYEADQEFDHVLYEHLCNVETAYKFYEDLSEALDASTVALSVEGEAIPDRIAHLMADERRTVEATTDLLDELEGNSEAADGSEASDESGASGAADGSGAPDDPTGGDRS
ncbi:rubrerythrin [Halococcoides cellulosivorans]|uniref:Rubrerythrin n=1 Tax=Halococcoides cellulosivorans TaxID=1679096 RepID=A0A2R4X253_9EURY|nr:rubrerythrin [Halococcoides cellulosivorans]AWB27864.1 rubrerythrin [Halococcoides cellulosivorans]